MPDLDALVQTPLALLDSDRMAVNIRRMQARMDHLGVALRPHVKTGKCLEILHLQRQAGAQGITVSTLKEAEQFFEDGCADVLYAVAIAPGKLDAVKALRDRGCRLKIIVDSVQGAGHVVAHGREHRHVHDVLIEIDSDGHRAGVAPESPLLIEIAQALHEGGARLLGVMTHAGGSYACDTPQALREFAEQERSRCVRAAERLREAGLPCPIVSVGSTPTALSAEHLSGVTEVRAGVYVFFDLVMAGIGVCGVQDIALSVLTTVIGHQPDKGWAIVDAGWMAMSRDRGTQTQRLDQGYGLVCGLDGRPLDDLIMIGANQEHGILAPRDGRVLGDLADRLPVGSRLRVLPNHACATATQFDAYHVQPQGAIWPRFRGW